MNASVSAKLYTIMSEYVSTLKKELQISQESLVKTNKIPKNMVDFIREHHVLSMATVQNGMPSSCSLFYSFMEDEHCFVFASDYETEHMKNILLNPDVSGVIHFETKEIEHIKGIQLKGMVEIAQSRHEHLYLKEYPYAADVKSKAIWKLKITELKYTDNNLGFGQKEVWRY
mgnify:CR=1 FL=1